MKNGNKIGEKSGKKGGWLVVMLGHCFQGPGHISKNRNMRIYK